MADLKTLTTSGQTAQIVPADWLEFLQETAKRAFKVFAARPRYNVASWSEEFRVLSREANAKGGKYRLAQAPYQQGPMEAVTDAAVQSVVLMWASQVGKTEVINNVVGFHIHDDPCPILILQPTLDMAETWSKDRLSTMLRDTSVLRDLVADARSRDSGNSILYKRFPGGHITIAGANSPASLAMRPIRVLLCDEIDRYPKSAGAEGDPIKLAEKRTDTFHNSVLFKTSTPTIKGLSRIEQDFQETDQCYWFCPCPRCGHFQTLKWCQVKFEFPNEDGTTRRAPEETVYVCENPHCMAHLSDADRLQMIHAGEWRATAPFKGKRGYHLNGLYSPFRAKKGYRSRLHQFAAEFLDAKAGGPEQLKVWTNTFLAETWADDAEKMEIEPLLRRREPYGPELPQGVILLVAGVDVQHDRLEGEIVGYGLGEETWGIEAFQLFGNPNKPEVWKDLDEFLDRTFIHANGAKLKIACACVDSGDPSTQKSVYAYVRPRQVRRIYAIKGSSQPGAPIATRPRLNKLNRIALYSIGTDVAKSTLYSRLKLNEPGPRYQHFPQNSKYDEEYFKQLTAEEVQIKYIRGERRRAWAKIRDRNEALDIRVYAMAAYEILNPNLPRIAAHLEASAANKTYILNTPAPSAATPEETKPPEPAPVPKPQKFPKHLQPKPLRTNGGGFVGRWKR